MATPSSDSAYEAAARIHIGERIRRARRARDMSQIALATALATRQGTVSEWENGHRRVGWSDAWRLAGALGRRFDELFGPPKTAEDLAQFNATVTHLRKLRAEGKRADRGGPR